MDNTLTLPKILDIPDKLVPIIDEFNDYRYFLEENRIAPQFFAPPTLEYTMPNLNFWIPSFQNPLSLAERAEAELLIPGLCRSYLNLGAFIGGEPAYDKDYKCIDFLTILQKSEVRKHLWKRVGGV